MPRIRPAKGQSAAPLIVTVILLVLILACGAFFIVTAEHPAPQLPEETTAAPVTDVPPEDTTAVPDVTDTPDMTDTPDITDTPDVTTDPAETDPVPDTTPAETTKAPEETTAPADGKWKTVAVTEGEIRTGNLILVNYQHEYKFPASPENVTFYGNKTAKYKLRGVDVSVRREALDAFNALVAEYNEKTGVRDIIVISGYRDFESQKTVYSDYVRSNGVAYAEKYVAQAGYSEHHTGLAVDLALYNDQGMQSSFSADATYPTFLELAAKHGFVLRYDPAKFDLTHIGGEEWHFRFVGYPHSHYMTVKKLCLEEYIDLLHGHTFSGEHLCFTDAASHNWEVYYVPSEGAKTALPVPTDAPYTVSGDNISGYIVTVQR